MVKITFFDVGQGDSIAIEWEHNQEKRIGIVDCCLLGRSGNPVVKYLQSREYDYGKIEFIALSHPHTDHYSGMEELFEYCRDRRILVKSFLHTLTNIGNEYWRWFELDTEDARRLRRIIDLSGELKTAGIIESIDTATAGWMKRLSDTLCLHCVSPSHDEVEKYQNLVKFAPESNPKAMSSGANLLSTVFRLEFGEEKYVLLTSDAEKMTFQRLFNIGPSEFHKHQMVLGQIPHHGSKKNHHPEYWHSIIPIGLEKKAVASSGQHGHYHHPDFEVLESMHGSGYKVYGTSKLNGMEEYHVLLRKSMALDTFSDIEEGFFEGGTISFEIPLS